MNEPNTRRDRVSLSVARLIDAHCDEFEAAWKAGQRPDMEVFLKRVPPIERTKALVELTRIDLEFRLTRQRVADQSRTRLEEYLGRYPELAEERQGIVDLCAHEYQLRVATGDDPTLDEYRQRFPQFGAEIEATLQRTVVPSADVEPRSAAKLQRPSGDDASPLKIRCPHCSNPIDYDDEESSFSNIECPSCGSSFSLDGSDSETLIPIESKRIAHFELIDRLGTGAFGTVWKARDTELDRAVAIKVPRKGQLSLEETDMFLREARAAAQLQHSNIVTVHEVGRSDESIYIVSDFVRGVNLSDWLTGHVPSAREGAELIAKIAEALHHAHEQGVIHRDLKPGNVMIDAECEPHVMDFGLAKREAGEVTMTLEGRVLGTPAYMSPEQARGEGHHVDRRTDVYSLGVMLFQFLTGELPFRGSPRMLIYQVIHEVPPDAATLNNQVPADLNTICTKALSKEPGRRYQTAQELSDDLRRYLRGEPIQARPVGRVEKTWRWCTRQPIVAGLSAAVLLLLTAVAVGALVAVVRINAERRRAVAAHAEAEANLKESNRQRQRAEESFRQVRQSVDDYFTTVSQSTLLNVPGLQPLRKELLESALEYYRQFIDGRGDDPVVRSELASAYLRVGSITFAIGSVSESQEAYEKAFAIRKRLAEEHPNSGEFQHDLAESFTTLANLQQETGRHERAVQSYEEAIAIRERLVGVNSEVQEYQDGLAHAYNNLGILYKQMGRAEEATQRYEKANGILEQLVLQNPDATNYQHRLAATFTNLGNLQDEAGQHQEGVRYYEKAITICERLVLVNPHVNAYQDSLATHYTSLGMLERRMRRHEKAARSHHKAIKTRERLVAQNPAVKDYRYELARSYERFGRTQREMDRPDEAVDSYRMALEIVERLAEQYPNVTDYNHSLAKGYGNVGMIECRAGRLEESAASYDKAIVILKALVRETPAVEDNRRVLADSRAQLLFVSILAGSSDAADNLAVATKIVERRPSVAVHQLALGAASYRAGEYYEARNVLPRAINYTKIATSLRQMSRSDADLFQAVATSFAAMTEHRLGNETEAQKLLAEAGAMIEERAHDSAVGLAQRIQREATNLIRDDDA